MTKKLTLLFALMLSTLMASATEIDGIYYELDSNTKQARVSFGDTKYTGSVIIPESVVYNDVTYSVTSIRRLAFSDCTGLTSVTIPNSVTSIRNQAFIGCSGLTSVTIGSGVTLIEELAFWGCSGLTEVHITDIAAWCKIDFVDYYSSNPLHYAGHLFMDGKEITDLVIPNSVTSIGKYAFYGCSGLTSIEIPNSVTSIGKQAFLECSALKKVIVKDIAAWCGIKFDDSFSNPLTYARHLFMDGKEIKDLVIPNSVTSIGNRAFEFCFGLTSIEIPNSVTSIGVGAFSWCRSLTSVTIPNSVTSISNVAFQCCSDLTSISVESGNPAYDSRNNCNAIIETATNNLIFGCRNTVIPNSVTSIGDYAFYGCYGLTSIEIPNSVTEIGEYAFIGCEGLTSITIPNSVISIGNWAFSNCSGLTSVTIPNSVISIESNAFEGTAWYNNQPDGLIYAGKVAYKYKGTMPENTSITIKDGTTCINRSAFEGCSGLTSIEIPNSIISIGDYAFSGCSGLTKVEINSNNIVSKIYSYSSSFKSIFGNQVKEYIIGDDVQAIGDSAFYECSGLTSVTIGNGVTSIGRSAFSGCSGLTSVTCEATSVPSTESDVFYNVPKSEATLYVPGSALKDYRTTAPWSWFGTIVYNTVTIDENTFPDSNFRNWVLSQDYGSDGVLTRQESSDVTGINVENKGIQSLKGIEYFTAITDLYCNNNQLTSLDVAENIQLTNLYCFSNHINGNDMDALIASFTAGFNKKMYVINNENEGNKMTSAQIAATAAKVWTPYYYDGSKWNKLYVPHQSRLQEGEYIQNIYDYTDTKCSLTPTTIDDARVSNGECLRIAPVSTNAKWEVTYYIMDLIPGKYNVHVVTLPKTMADETETDRPVKYKIKMQYCNQDNQEIVNDCGAFASIKDEITDNVVEDVEIFGNYVKIALSGNANPRLYNKETSEMYLDYIYLESLSLRGDANGDGEVNMSDAKFIVDYCILDNPDPSFNAEAADVNGDGKIGMPDVMFIINYIQNGKFPDEE